jgi:hypothetical protein
VLPDCISASDWDQIAGMDSEIWTRGESTATARAVSKLCVTKSNLSRIQQGIYWHAASSWRVQARRWCWWVHRFSLPWETEPSLCHCYCIMLKVTLPCSWCISTKINQII